MQKFTFHRTQTGFFSEQSNRQAYGQEELLPFINLPFSEKNLLIQAKNKLSSYPVEHRKALVQSLQKQYASLEKTAEVQENIEALGREQTVTITTGHQLGLFTGPVYTIYKILHVIRLTEELNGAQSGINFVPVFWLASEDHDFEEVKEISFFGKQIEWATEQKGAVGRFNVSGLEECKAAFLKFFERVDNQELNEALNAYAGETYADATQSLFNHLFGKYGLIVLNPDQLELKNIAKSMFSQELKEKKTVGILQETNQAIRKEGLKVQVNPREINLFYLSHQSRQRIQPLENDFFIEGKGKVGAQELLNELDKHPERFSPNVVLRPVYQEIILPNVCYIGGVGEISYWLQLKAVFDAFSIPFPLIQPRTSMTILDGISLKKMEKTGLVIEDLFRGKESVKAERLSGKMDEDIDMSNYQGLKAQLLKEMKLLKDNLSPEFRNQAGADLTKIEQQLGYFEQRIKRNTRATHQKEMETIDQVFDRLFPNGGLQERKVNFFHFCSDGRIERHIENLYKSIHPFNPDFVFVKE